MSKYRKKPKPRQHAPKLARPPSSAAAPGLKDGDGAPVRFVQTGHQTIESRYRFEPSAGRAHLRVHDPSKPAGSLERYADPAWPVEHLGEELPYPIDRAAPWGNIRENAAYVAMAEAVGLSPEMLIEPAIAGDEYEPNPVLGRILWLGLYSIAAVALGWALSHFGLIR